MRECTKNIPTYISICLVWYIHEPLTSTKLSVYGRYKIPVKFPRHNKVSWMSIVSRILYCVTTFKPDLQYSSCPMAMMPFTKEFAFLAFASADIILCTAISHSDDFALLLSLQIFYNKHAALARPFISGRCIPWFKIAI